MKTCRAFLILFAWTFQAIDAGANPVAITSLDLSKVHQGWGSPQIDVSVDKRQPLTINGKVFSHGLGTHADSYFAIKLNKGSTRFIASVGVDDEVGSPVARIKFFVYGDERLLWQSGDLGYRQDASAVDVDVTGVSTLMLIALGTGNGNLYDHADWADATLEVTGAAPVAIEPPIEDSAEILTPPVPDTPRINGPKIFGVRPHVPFLYAIPASGKRPLHYSVEGLPPGLTVNSDSGLISGSLNTEGTFDMELHVQSDLGADKKRFRIVVGDQIALTPPMGWSSWNCWLGEIDQGKVTRAAHAMVDSGLASHGFTYINVDDTWQGSRGGPLNAIQPDPKRFPNLKAMVDEIHGLNLKAGIYSTPWVTSYGKRIGGSSESPDGRWDTSMTSGPMNQKKFPFTIGKYHFFTNDAQQWAEWGFDYLKFDWAPMEPTETKEMSNALKAAGRDVVFSLSNNSTNTVLHDLPEISQSANLWRISGDINDSWSSLCGNALNRDSYAPFSQPGNYNDPDMMVLGYTFGHPTHLNHNEQYLHMSLWCLLAAPLLLGCDLEKLDDFTKGLLTNDEVIDLDQDILCQQAKVVSKQNQALVYAKPLEGGSWAVGLFNLGPIPEAVAVQWSDLGITGKQVVRDVWRQKNLGSFEGSFSTSVHSHGVVLVRLNPEN